MGYSEDMSKGREHAQATEEGPSIWAARLRTLEDANCEALRRGAGTSGEGGNASDHSKYERR